MKLPQLFGAAIGGGAKLIGTASSLTVLIGATYLIDCRISARGAGLDAIDRCYLSALPMMGLGAGAAGGWLAGFNTLNPALRKDDRLGDRDEHGRFRRRDG